MCAVKPVIGVCWKSMMGNVASGDNEADLHNESVDMVSLIFQIFIKVEETSGQS